MYTPRVINRRSICVHLLWLPNEIRIQKPKQSLCFQNIIYNYSSNGNATPYLTVKVFRGGFETMGTKIRLITHIVAVVVADAVVCISANDKWRLKRTTTTERTHTHTHRHISQMKSRESHSIACILWVDGLMSALHAAASSSFSFEKKILM